MTSDISFISKINQKYDHSALHEYTPPNGTLSHRLLSPITENSAEILPKFLTLNKTCSDASQKTPVNIVLPNDHSTTDELCQRFHQYTSHFRHLQTYLDVLQQHFKALSIIIERLRDDQHFLDIFQPIETRLVQMRAKRDQIDHLLNHSSIQTIIQQISSFVLQGNFTLDYSEFLTSIQLSLNQKSILIDHWRNDYRCQKYQLTEYSSKLRQRHELLMKLTNQIEQFLVTHQRRSQRINQISIINEHHRQSIQLIHLSEEYEQLQNENHLLTLKAKEKIQKYSQLLQSPTAHY